MQKPAWSEEDEAHINGIMDYLLDYKLLANEEDMNVANGVQEEINWLKSLKDRYTWKPSDEQIKAIRLARSFVTDDFGEHPTLSEILIELEAQLKKLK